MLPLPRTDLYPNTPEYENYPLVKPSGFREYDARWLFGAGINLYGVQALGMGLGTLIHELDVQPEIVTGHDYRAYSLSIKQALITGLMAAGVRVHDIGLALSPTAYFAQFDLDIPCVAMVTASHNDNGWTGVKMGVEKPLTFGPDEMSRLKDIVLKGLAQARPGGSYTFVEGMHRRYCDDLVGERQIRRRLKAVIACGNGTAGAFAPDVLKRSGIEVIPLDCEPDHTFPRYNPNPEDLTMLSALQQAVLDHRADLGLAFDGDGDRCGLVDNEGEAIFADKAGVLLARDLSSRFPEARFVVDVKSTSLFMHDPVLQENGTQTEYWKTGHSYIKRRAQETGALAGFEKSGHYFFQPPLGRGYDDGLVSALAVLDMLDHHPSVSLADMRRSLPQTWSSPTMSPSCADEKKYAVIADITKFYQNMAEQGELILGQKIRDILTVNGIRITLDDGTWGLVRASSNTPNLVVVVESPVSEDQMIAMFRSLEAHLATIPEVGAYDQKI